MWCLEVDMDEYNLCIGYCGSMFIDWSKCSPPEDVLIYNVRNLDTIVQFDYDSDSCLDLNSIEIVFTCFGYKECEKKLRRLKSPGKNYYHVSLLWTEQTISGRRKN